MALTDNDKQWIKGAIVEGINGALETVVTPRFDALEKDVSGLKQDVSGLKQDVSGLKQDVSGLKQDISSLKDEMREVKNRLSGVEHEVYEAKERLDRVEGELQALTNDIKEIYDVIYGKPSRSFMSASFAKMSPKVINEELLKMAKATGVVLPR